MLIQQQNRHLLGSACDIRLVTKEPAQVVSIFDELWDQLERFEQRFSRFLPDSELTQFNEQAGKRVAVSEAFRHLLQTASRLGEDTEGLYNPFVLPTLQQAGYLHSWGEKNSNHQTPDFRNRHMASGDHIEIGDDWARIPANTAIDFGGCGKGYALDQLAKYLDDHDISDYSLSLGGDIICSGAEPGLPGWRISIQDAHQPERDLIEITSDGTRIALATSGTIKRRGEGWHHIIDPRTGKPADTDILSATVTASSGALADVLAKCMVIVGAKTAPGLAAEHTIHSFIIQTSDINDNVIHWGKS